MANIPIFQQDGFRIGIGDSNGDGRIDWDFGLRHDQYGSSPWGYHRRGGEVGINSQRGVYVGGDYQDDTAWGSRGGGARVFGDGGYQAGNWSNDVFGNYNRGYANSSPWGYQGGNDGGNVYTGDYYGNRQYGNGWGNGSDAWAGNRWNGAQTSTHYRGDVWGNEASWGSFRTPPFVPSHGGGYYGGCGCQSVGRFMAF
ncbi:MAG: hypothetical protein HY319_21785 [Armatimonadetes bacterium]|nr:hypothetical protein [Armatimonadota bacterium]